VTRSLQLPRGWESWEPQQKQALLDTLQAAVAERRKRGWVPYPWQRPHVHPDEHTGPCTERCRTYPDAPPIDAHGMFLQMGGRGTGKTDGATHYVLRHVAGPPCDPRMPGGHRLAIVAPTLGDAIESCVTGPSGLRAYDPRVRHYSSTGGTYVRFHGGAVAKVFGAHTPNDVDRLRAGGNRCLVWLEEAAAQRQLRGVIEHSAFGLRVGPAPHYVASTTPKARPEIKAMMTSTRTVMTRGTTQQATHLDERVRSVLYELYAGTSTGRQELGGELLDDIEGALWRRASIDSERIEPGAQPQLSRVVVAVDPNAGGGDEAGIVVAGIGSLELPDRNGYVTQHAYVLSDESAHYSSSDGWARAAVQAYHRWGADAIVAETNNGGDMVGLTVRTIDPTVRYKSVTATRGKAVRAEPCVGLYEQLRVHHVGVFPKLEDQQTEWTEEAGYSPDRMDALVWALTELLLQQQGGGFASVA
jgi:phage terminase large subunit-like protein